MNIQYKTNISTFKIYGERTIPVFSYFNSTVDKIIFDIDKIIPYYGYLFKQGSHYSSPDVFELVTSINSIKDEALNNKLNLIRLFSKELKSSTKLPIEFGVRELFITENNSMYLLIDDFEGNYKFIFNGHKSTWNLRIVTNLDYIN